MTFGESLRIVAPYYNLVLVVIALVMFLKLFSLRNKKIYMLPWYLLFAAVVVFIVEEILTVFYYAGIYQIPRIMNAVFEFIIISLFIYMLLKQKEYVKGLSKKTIKKTGGKNAK